MATEKENCPKQDLVHTIFFFFLQTIWNSWEIINISEQFSDFEKLYTYIPTQLTVFLKVWGHQAYFILYHIEV